MRKVLEVVQDVMDVVKEVTLIFCALLSMIREFLVIVVFTFLGVNLSNTVDERNMVVVVCLAMCWACLVLRAIHVEHKMNKTKKFTHIDKFGNPCINTEDLPEIIEYLYQLEMEED